MAVVDAGASQVGRVAVGGWIGVEVAVDHRLLDTPVAEGRLEPEPVALDRTANARIEIPDLPDFADVADHVVRVVEGAAAQVAAQVARLPSFAGEVPEHRSAEGIAPVLRNHVDADAALRHLGGIGPGDVTELREAAVVPVDAAVRAVRLEVVQPHPIDGL